jgi:F-type H+-transporting ATPase subunit delta
MSGPENTRQPTVLDSDAQQVADLYGRAILEAAGENADEVVGQLTAIVEECLNTFPALEAVLDSPRVNQSEKEAIIDRVFRDRVHGTLLNSLKVLCRRGRIGSLRGIQLRACELQDEKQGILRVLVTSAVPLSDEQRQQISDQVGRKLGKSLRIEERVDPSLLGGLMLRVGDQVYDGSILGKMSSLRATVASGIQKAVRERSSSLLSP